MNIHLGEIWDYYLVPMKVKAREKCVKSLQECVESANDADVKLCIENDPDKQNMLQFGEQADNLFGIVNEICEDVGITLDVGHANTTKTPVLEFIKRIRYRLYTFMIMMVLLIAIYLLVEGISISTSFLLHQMI